MNTSGLVLPNTGDTTNKAFTVSGIVALIIASALGVYVRVSNRLRG
ncbi:MAG TPA: LPXTG cell wall anchor domain-containing protein [Lactobacillaceae bacterium]